MTNEDYNHQEKAYHNYLRAFYPTIQFKETIYKDLYTNLIDENLTRTSMGDFFYKKYLNKINENIKKIEIEITNYIEINSLKDDAKEYLLYFKPLLENKILELLNSNKQIPTQSTLDKTPSNNKPKKLTEKWYALLYWIELESTGQKLHIAKEGGFIKSEIEEIGKNRTGRKGQGFYRDFKKIELHNTKLTNSIYGSKWKETIIELSKNNEIIIKYLKENYI